MLNTGVFFKDNQELRIMGHNLISPSTAVLPRYFLYTYALQIIISPLPGENYCAFFIFFILKNDPLVRSACFD